MPDGSERTSVPASAPLSALGAPPPLDGGLVHAEPSVRSMPSVMVQAVSQHVTSLAMLRPTAASAAFMTLGSPPQSTTTMPLSASLSADASSAPAVPGWTGQTSLMRCMKSGCDKARRAGGAPYCKSHGGGRRCQVSGCTRSAASGGELLCGKHGGGKRCLFTGPGGCERMARPGTTADKQFCAAHGGGRRCKHDGCNKSARCGENEYCAAHGGGAHGAAERLRKPSQPSPPFYPATHSSPNL